MHIPRLWVAALSLLITESAFGGEHKIDAFFELGPNFTNNAFFAEDDEKQDGYLGPSYGLQFAGPLSKSFSYYSRVFLSDVRFDDFSVLNNDSGAVLLELKYTNGPWLVTGRANPQWTYTEGFDQFQIALYDFYLIAQRSFTYGALTIKPKVSASRLESSTVATERSRVGPSIDLSYKIAEGKTLNFRASSIYQMYDEPIGRDDRNDWRFGLTAGFNWTVKEWLTTGIGVGFSRNESTIAGKSWSRFDVTPVLNMSMKLGRVPE